MEKNNIQNSVIAFKTGRITRRELLKELNELILKTPAYYGYYDADIKYEFYATIISKIEKILKFYKEIQNATFTTWFNVVLKRQFYYFIKKYKNQELETVEYIDEIKTDERNNQQHYSYEFDYSIFSEREQEILGIKFGLNELADSRDIIIDKLSRKRLIEEKITNRYLKMIKLQKQIQLENDSFIINNLKEKLDKIIYSKRRLENLFNRFNMLPSNKWVGEKLGISEGTVGAFLNKIKIKIEKNNALKELF